MDAHPSTSTPSQGGGPLKVSCMVGTSMPWFKPRELCIPSRAMRCKFQLKRECRAMLCKLCLYLEAAQVCLGETIGIWVRPGSSPKDLSRTDNTGILDSILRPIDNETSTAFLVLLVELSETKSGDVCRARARRLESQWSDIRCFKHTCTVLVSNLEKLNQITSSYRIL
jgi:hypothetical protein